jgi:hypothetical protein
MPVGGLFHSTCRLDPRIESDLGFEFSLGFLNRALRRNERQAQGTPYHLESQFHLC